MNLHAVASHIGKGIYEMDDMPVAEFHGWIAYLHIIESGK